MTAIENSAQQRRNNAPIKTTTAQIVAALAGAAHALTTIEVAALLDEPLTRISSRLSGLADRGLIQREYRGTTNQHGVYHRYCVWSAKTVEATS